MVKRQFRNNLLLRYVSKFSSWPRIALYTRRVKTKGIAARLQPGPGRLAQKDGYVPIADYGPGFGFQPKKGMTTIYPNCIQSVPGKRTGSYVRCRIRTAGPFQACNCQAQEVEHLITFQAGIVNLDLFCRYRGGFGRMVLL